MKTKLKKIAPLVISLMIASLVGVSTLAEAASISSRVRILESKVYKNSKEIRKLKKTQQLHGVKIEHTRKEMDDFKEQVMQMIADAQKKAKKKAHSQEGPFNEYAYP